MSGLFVPSTAYTVPPSTSVSGSWKRNPSWPTFVSPSASEEKIVGLWAVHPGDNFFACTMSGNYTVDFGDGTVTNYAAGVQANYTYSYSNPALDNTNAPVTFTASTGTVNRTAHNYANGDAVAFYGIVSTTGLTEGRTYYVINRTSNSFQVAATVDGTPIALTNDGSANLLPYKIAIVTITPQAGQNLTSVNLGVKHSQSNLPIQMTSGWLDLVVSAPYSTTLTLIDRTNGVQHQFLEQVALLSTATTSLFKAFQNFMALKKVAALPDVTAVTNMANMFENCFVLEEIAPFSGTVASVTNMSYMFNCCYMLRSIPAFPGALAVLQDMSYMFQNCYSLTAIPAFPGTVATVTNMSYMFYSCSQLEEIPAFPGSVGAVTNMSYMFAFCRKLKRIVPFPGTVAAVTNMSYMFQNCTSLPEIPPFPGTVAAVTNMSYMFQNCLNLRTIPPFPGTVAAAQNMSYMFQNCYNLIEVPPFPGSVAAVTNMAGMFNTCPCLKNVPPWPGPVSSVMTMAYMFGGCTSLMDVPIFPGTPSVLTDVNNMLFLVWTPRVFRGFAGSVASITNTNNLFSNTQGLTSITGMNGLSASTSIANCSLGAPALQSLFGQLASNVTGKTLTISVNPGVDAAVTKTSICSTTAGSSTVLCSNTSGITAGMLATGAGLAISTDVTVSSDVAANTLGKTAHGLPNGTPIAFTALGTTTGVTLKTIYYVVNTAADTFQIALTPGGAAIDLTGTNAAGMTIRYAAYVTAVNTDVSFTLSLPAASTLSNQTHTFRLLDSSTALLKGWSITY